MAFKSMMRWLPEPRNRSEISCCAGMNSPSTSTSIRLSISSVTSQRAWLGCKSSVSYTLPVCGTEGWFCGGTTPVLRAGTAPAHAGFPVKGSPPKKGKPINIIRGQAAKISIAHGFIQRAAFQQNPRGTALKHSGQWRRQPKQTDWYCAVPLAISRILWFCIVLREPLIKCNTISCIVLRQIITIGQMPCDQYTSRAAKQGQGRIKYISSQL